MQGLHEEYHQKCSIEDQDARARAQQDANGQRQAQMAQRESALAERRRAKERADRCTSMRELISRRRKRERELDAKQVEALRAIESTYNEICMGG